MPIELGAVMCQPERPRSAHKQLQPHILFKARDRPADGRFRLVEKARRGGDAALLRHSDEGRQMINVPFHEHFVHQLYICSKNGISYPDASQFDSTG